MNGSQRNIYAGFPVKFGPGATVFLCFFSFAFHIIFNTSQSNTHAFNSNAYSFLYII